MTPRPDPAPSRRPAPMAFVLATAALAAAAALHAPDANAGYSLPGDQDYNYGFGAVATAASGWKGGEYQAVAAASYSDVNVVGQASTSLRGGSVHALAWTSNDPQLPGYCKPYMPWCNWSVGAAAYYWDSITITTGIGYVWGEAIDLFWDTSGDVTRGKWWTRAYGTSRFYAGYSPTGHQSVPKADISKDDLHVHRAFAAPSYGETLTIYLFGEILAYAEGGGVADFSHSGHFNWSIPEGLTWTSASGQLIAPTVRPASPVPVPVPVPNAVDEPAPFALAGLGLAAVGFARRRRMAPQAPGGDVASQAR